MGFEADRQTLHILFFPFMAPGHMLPLVDMATLFAARGVRATILTTPANSAVVQPTIARAHNSNLQLLTIPFPSSPSLPAGCESLSSVPAEALEADFFASAARLRQPFDRVLCDLLPDCVVSDSFLPWTLDVATRHGVPRISFHGTSFFALSAPEKLLNHGIFESLSRQPADTPFVIPDLPHRIEMRKSMLQDHRKMAPIFAEHFRQLRESDANSYGVVVNSFYELEPDYADHFRDVMGRRAWHVGPVALCNRDAVDRSGEAILNWLDGKEPRSVLYICFGSLCRISEAQLAEMALGFEASGHSFLWVVRKDNTEDWMPEGYETRVGGRGLIIRGWAPQVLILSHKAVGGFVTHCGWNSCLEGISAGVPLVTWPLFAEQFFNERLAVDVLRIGVGVGSKEYSTKQEEREVLGREKVEVAVRRVMGGGEEADERRRRAAEFGEKARRAVEEGGSSHVDLGNLIRELVERKNVQSRKQLC